LNHGVCFAPALYEAGFISAAHTAQDVERKNIERTMAATQEVFAGL
jgi:glutamate-1-semialdehyde 2,1-aminomutase